MTNNFPPLPHPPISINLEFVTPPDGSLAVLTCRKSLAHAEASSESENYEGGGFENNTLFYFFYFYASEGVLVVSSFLWSIVDS